MAREMGTTAGETGKGRQGPFLRGICAISNALDWAGQIIGVSCLAFMFVALLVNVVLRYAFGSGIAWAYEIHALVLPWLVAAGVVIAAARSRNIAITLLPFALSGRGRLALLFAIHVLMLIISVAVLWSSQPILRAAQYQSLSTLGIKQIWGYASLVFAFSGTAVIAAIDAIRVLYGVDTLDSDPEHASLS
ncbi:MAG: TRAP transporter small permease [Hyphomicrobiaceae bacterium]